MTQVFSFIDKVSEIKKNECLTAFFTLKGNEEFLKDHFDGFPVMPGVLMLESLKQAAGRLLAGEGKNQFFRIVSCEDVKFGQFVRPGSHLKIEAKLLKKENDKAFFEGRIDIVEAPSSQGAVKQKALFARLVLEPVF